MKHWISMDYDGNGTNWNSQSVTCLPVNGCETIVIITNLKKKPGLSGKLVGYCSTQLVFLLNLLK
jgi:hypothetical protein